MSAKAPMLDRSSLAPSGRSPRGDGRQPADQVVPTLQRMADQSAGVNALSAIQRLADRPPIMQRKIKVGGKPYFGDSDSDKVVTDAMMDEFVRDYRSETEMKRHLVEKAPVSVGLIPKLALWYRLPYLPDTFFALGESHNAVRGSDIKNESNITKPILDEKLTGWSVSDVVDESFDEEEVPTTDQGLDENASKLTQALLYAQFVEKQAVQKRAALDAGAAVAPTGGPKLPDIPVGQDSARETKTGSRKLAVRGEDGEARWWTPREPLSNLSGKGQAKKQSADWDIGKEARSAVNKLFPIVFADEIEEGTLDDVVPRLNLAWTLFAKESWKTTPSNTPNVLLPTIINGAAKKMRSEYKTLRDDEDTEHREFLPDPDTLKSADDHRDAFMTNKVLTNATLGTFAFAVMGNNHLKAMKKAIEKTGVKYISSPDFYDKYSEVAVDLSPQADETPGSTSESRATLQALDLSNVLTNQLALVVEAVEANKMPALKQIKVNERSWTPELNGRMKAAGVAVTIMR